MAASRDAWASGFARQARSDWEIFRKFNADPNVPFCHPLHYLQMACEKIAKAYRTRDTDVNAFDLRSRHVGFEKFVNAFFLSPKIKRDFENRDAQRKIVAAQARRIAVEVEKLAPSIDKAATPSNSEYPWEDGDEIRVPCEHGFPNLTLLRQAGGRAFLKLIDRAIFDFETKSVRIQ